jgi:hypothetical protein
MVTLVTARDRRNIAWSVPTLISFVHSQGQQFTQMPAGDHRDTILVLS